MRNKTTVSALHDCSYTPPGSNKMIFRLDEVEIPLAITAKCKHTDTLCPHCVSAWQREHLFTETLPWNRPHAK